MPLSEGFKRVLARFGDIIILGITVALVIAYKSVPKFKALLPLSEGEGILLTIAGLLTAGVVNLQKLALGQAIQSILDQVRRDGVRVHSNDKLGKYLSVQFQKGPSIIRIVDTDPSKDLQQDRGYLEARSRLLREGGTQFRLVYLDDPADLGGVEAMMKENLDFDLRVACLTKLPQDKPIFPLLVIDESEVHLGDTFLGDKNSTTYDIGIESEAVAKSFVTYFRHLWDPAEKLKVERGRLNEETIARVREELEEKSQPKLVVNEYREKNYPRLTEITRGAKRIEIVSFPQLTSDNVERQKYYHALHEAIQNDSQHRRLIWNKDHLEFVERWLKDNEDLRTSTLLEIRFLRQKEGEPLLVFDLLDRKTVVLAQNLVGEAWVQVNDKRFGEFLGHYFDVLWDRAKGEVVKSRHETEPNWELLKELKAELSRDPRQVRDAVLA